MERALYQKIWKELSDHKEMVFLAGPRQSGKTTLARMVARAFANQVYFNWDLDTDRLRLIQNPTFFDEVPRRDDSPPLVIFDEIHKYKRWKNYLKGVYDGYAERYRFFILGSGRLNVFQKGGDSLSGRYALFTLWPFTLAELADRRRPFEEFKRNPLKPGEDQPPLESYWKQLSILSGFPEPYLSGREQIYRRWFRSYRQQLIREDIRNLTGIKDLDHVEILFSLLPSKVASPLSMDSLARDLQVSFNSIRNWLNVFESFYLTFRVEPWIKKISRGITKQKKLYLYNYANIPDPAARFENMVALELLRAVTNWNDLGDGDFSLHYVRNKEGEEVDFLIADGHAPQLLVEVKEADDHIPKSLLKFQKTFQVPAVLLVNRPGVYREISNQGNLILVISAPRWLATLP